MTYLLLVALLAVVALFIKWPELFDCVYAALDIPPPLTEEELNAQVFTEVSNDRS